MLRMKEIGTYEDLMSTETGRPVDVYEDPEYIRLTALNLELAAKNLFEAGVSPECLVLSADLCEHKLVAKPNAAGNIEVLVYEL